MTDKLTPKQAAFCREYILDMNGSQAYIRAGYSPNGAKTSASKLLTNPNVHELINKLLAERAARTEITADNILRALWDNHRLALERGELHNSTRALELCGKAQRMFVDRVEQSVTVYDGMSEAELDAAISQAEKDIELVRAH